jgi:hypothetical protein
VGVAAVVALTSPFYVQSSVVLSDVDGSDFSTAAQAAFRAAIVAQLTVKGVTGVTVDDVIILGVGGAAARRMVRVLSSSTTVTFAVLSGTSAESSAISDGLM